MSSLNTLVSSFLRTISKDKDSIPEEVYNYILSEVSVLSDVQFDSIIEKLVITDTNTEELLNRCASLVYFYGSKQNQTHAFLEYIDEIMNNIEALFMKQYREENPKNAFKEKEADIKRLLTLDANWQLFSLVKSVLSAIKNEYETICRAFDVQSRMLMSVNKRELFEKSNGM